MLASLDHRLKRQAPRPPAKAFPNRCLSYSGKCDERILRCTNRHEATLPAFRYPPHAGLTDTWNSFNLPALFLQRFEANLEQPVAHGYLFRRLEYVRHVLITSAYKVHLVLGMSRTSCRRLLDVGGRDGRHRRIYSEYDMLAFWKAASELRQL